MAVLRPPPRQLCLKFERRPRRRLTVKLTVFWAKYLSAYSMSIHVFPAGYLAGLGNRAYIPSSDAVDGEQGRLR